MSNFADALSEVEAAGNLEAWRDARELVLKLEPRTEQEKWQVELRKVWLCQPYDEDKTWRLPLDESRLALHRLVDSPHAEPDDAERASINALQTDLARRRRTAVTATLATIEKRWGATPRVIAFRARTLMAFDDREGARQILEHALTTQSSHHLHAAYADLLYIVADFDRAEHHASLLKDTPYAINGADLAVGVAASRGDLEAELRAITYAIDLAPRSEMLAARLAHRALVFASLDDLDAARTDLQQALAVAPHDERENHAEYVRHRLDAIDAAGPDTKHRRLDAFPTVLQKWNYCGPAVIELCLRYLGIEMTQDLIAQAVKNEEGTPMLAIVEFLREQGLEARRVEATPERLRAAIDLGVPVILDDDYSNSHHVVVAMGYDDRLGVLMVADPMTHAPRRQGIELRDTLASHHRFGGVAVLGRTADVSDELRAALDEAGLIERPHIAALDEISRVHHDISPAFSETTPLEAGGHARAALALEPRFPLAAILEVNALASGTSGSDSGLATMIADARIRFPEVSAFATFASQWNHRRGNTSTAIGEAAFASTLDLASAQPRIELALNLASAGDRVLAYRYANDAILRAPTNPTATFALARVVVDDLAERLRAQGRLGTSEAALMLGPVDGTPDLLPLDLDTVTALAAQVSEAAAEMAPLDANVLIARGDYLLIAGDLAAARTAYEAAAKEAPAWFLPSVRLAHVLEATGDASALSLAMRVASAGAMAPDVWSTVLHLIARLGSHQDIIDAGGVALDGGLEPRLPAGAIFDAVEHAGRSGPDAARTLVTLARSRAADASVMYGVCDVLEQHDLSGYAVALLRERLNTAPHDAEAHFALARTIRSTPANAEEALLHTERTHRLVPWASGVATDLGWMIVDSDPDRALELATSAREPSPATYALRTFALTKLGRIPEAKAIAAEQAAFHTSPARANAAVLMDHVLASRYARIAGLDVSFTPSWVNPDDVLFWLSVQVHAGNARGAATLLEYRPEVAAQPRIAAQIATLGAGVGADLVATACRRAAELEAKPERAVELEVRARLALQEFEGIGEIAGDNVAALVCCAELIPDAAQRLTCARRAAAFAPHDRAVLASLHAALFDNGLTTEAGEVARKLYDDYPFQHQGAERLAEFESFTGDPHAALEFATTAVSQAPHCARAHAALAIAAAVTGDWDTAAIHVIEGAQRNTDPADIMQAAPETLVAAAVERDQGAFEASLARIRRMTPDAQISRLETACRERIASAPLVPDVT